MTLQIIVVALYIMTKESDYPSIKAQELIIIGDGPVDEEQTDHRFTKTWKTEETYGGNWLGIPNEKRKGWRKIVSIDNPRYTAPELPPDRGL